MLPMISPDFDLVEFLHVIEDRNLHDILRLSESEATEAEKVAEVKGYGMDYADAVRDFAYLMRYGQKPIGVDEERFRIFRAVCEKLITKKQLLPHILELFDSEE
jgi:hypothetical protein